MCKLVSLCYAYVIYMYSMFMCTLYHYRRAGARDAPGGRRGAGVRGAPDIYIYIYIYIYIHTYIRIHTYV